MPTPTEVKITNSVTPEMLKKPEPNFVGTHPLYADLWVMHFRHGMQPHCSKGFHCEGGLRSAVARARQHCEKMNYTLHFVLPLVSDLNDEEERRNKGLNV